MSADNMPPLPVAQLTTMVRGGCYMPDQMHAYARAYAAEQTRELVEALELLLVGNRWATLQGCTAWHEKQMPSDAALSNARALIAKHKGAA